MPVRLPRSPLVVALAVLVVAGALAADARAQSDRREVTLEDALRLFSEHSLALRASRADAHAEIGWARQAAAWPNPEVSLSHEPLYRDGDTYSESYLTLAQRFEWPSNRGARIEAASRLAEAARMRVAADSARMAYDVARRYVEASAHGERVALWREVVVEARTLARSMAASLAEGVTSGYDERRMRIELARYEVSLSEAELARLDAERSLAYQVVPEDDVLRLVPSDSFGAVPGLPPLEDLLRRALDDRPEVTAARLEAESASAQLRAARTARAPAPALSAGYKRQSDGFDGFVVGLSLGLPVFDRNAGGIAAETQRSLGADLRVDLAARMVENDVRLAHARYASLLEREAVLADRLLDETGDLLDIAKAGYREGELSLLEVLDAMDTQATARLSRMDLLASLWIAYFDVLRAVGLPITEGA